MVCHKDDNNANVAQVNIPLIHQGAIKLTVCILRIIKASATHNTRVWSYIAGAQSDCVHADDWAHDVCKRSQCIAGCTNTLVAAHQRLASIPEIELPQEVSRDDCHSLVTTEEYEGPDGQRHRVPLGKTTVLNFYEKGRQYSEGDTLVCEGEKVKLGDRVIDGVAILEQIKITTG